ncbi:hypothetical protein Bca4012_038221 [Brassica carinata]
MARPSVTEAARLKLISEGCGPKTLYQKEVKRDPQALFGEVFKTHNAIQTLDKTISSLEMELAAARSTQESLTNGAPVSNDVENNKQLQGKKIKYLMVVGINTWTWMPQGSKQHFLAKSSKLLIPIWLLHVENTTCR